MYKIVNATTSNYSVHLTTISRAVSIVENTIYSLSYAIDCKVVLICALARRNTAVVCEVSVTTGEVLLLTDGSDHIIVHTFSTIHWRLETDYS